MVPDWESAGLSGTAVPPIAEGPLMKGKDEVVGKGRPPAGTRWKPGQSGNPKGRPKGVKNMMTYFNQALSRKVNLRIGERSYRVTVREGIAMVITNLALKGDLKLIPLVLSIDRDINAKLKSENIKTITSEMTPREAMELYRRTLNGDYED
jgi:Family of unknown function (DUF5681)